MHRPRSASLAPGDSIAAASRVLVGTSGYNDTVWKGSCYPDTLSSKKMLLIEALSKAATRSDFSCLLPPVSCLLEDVL